MRELVVSVSNSLRPIETKTGKHKTKRTQVSKQLYSDALFSKFKESVIHGEFLTDNQRQIDEATFRAHVREYMSMFYFAGTNRYEFDYTELKLLGRGGYGGVYKAKNKWDNGAYAIKKIVYEKHIKIRCVLDISLYFDDFIRSNNKTFREVSALAKWNHPNIVRYNSAWIQFVPSTTETTSSTSDSMMSKSATMNLTLGQNSTCSDDQSDNSNSGFTVSTNDSGVAKSSAPNDYSSFKPWSLGSLANSLSFAPKKQTNSSDGITFTGGCTGSNFLTGSNTNYSVPTTSSVYDAAAMDRLIEAYGDLTMFIQMELCHCSLRDYIDARNKALTTMTGRSSVLSQVDIEANKYLFRGVLEGILYIHNQAHIHRDLKPHNIFLGMADWKDEGKDIKKETDWWKDVKKFAAKVGDFGLVTDRFGHNDKDIETEASQCGTSNPSLWRTTHVGTVAYAAPEQLSQTPSMYDEKVDIYPLGIILFELYHPFGTSMERAKIIKELRLGKFPPEFISRWPEEHALILRMMSNDPSLRPSAEDILDSPVFATAPPASPSQSSVSTLTNTESAESEIARLKAALAASEKEVQELRRQMSELKTRC